jgi:hypothetical protein
MPVKTFSVFFEYAKTTTTDHFEYLAESTSFQGCVNMVKAITDFQKITGYRVITADGVEIINSPWVQLENI